MFRIFAEGDVLNSSNSESSEQPLGILPHQIRGSLAQFSQMTLVGHSSDSCTACCSTVSFPLLVDFFHGGTLRKSQLLLKLFEPLVLYAIQGINSSYGLMNK